MENKIYRVLRVKEYIDSDGNYILDEQWDTPILFEANIDNFSERFMFAVFGSVWDIPHKKDKDGDITVTICPIDFIIHFDGEMGYIYNSADNNKAIYYAVSEEN